MTSTELSKIVWAQSFVGVHIMDPPVMTSHEYNEQLLIAWETLSAGVDALRVENTKLLNAMAFIDEAMERAR